MTALDGGARLAAVPADPLAPRRRPEAVVARVLTIGSYASVALLVAGVAAMLGTGIPPLTAERPVLDPARLPADLAALRPTGFLWLGIIVAIAMPATRVAVALVGYIREHDRRMVAVSIAILGVIALAVALSTTTA